MLLSSRLIHIQIRYSPGRLIWLRKMKLHYIAFLFFLLDQNVDCVKILGIFPLASKSHYILASSLMQGLAEKGHDVTVINPFGEKNPPKNGTYRDIIVDGFLSSGTGFNLFDIQQMNFITFGLFMNYLGDFSTETVLGNPNVQKLLKSDEKFDVVILEQFVNDGLKVFAYHYKVPLVLFSTFGSNVWVNSLVANPSPPSYVPEQNIKFDHKNFWDRLRNFVIYVFGELNRHLIFFPSQNKIMKKYFPDAPNLDILNYNASLVLLNSHLSTNKALPRVPSMVDIGGFHIQPPKKLPKHLQEYLDSAKDGAIYFSMGSGLRSASFPPEKRDAFLKVFAKLKQKVLWKWEDDTLPGQPPNVKLGKWLPQQDILAHPNIRAFVTHGGLLSLTESIYHGVPVLSIPIFGDQVWNSVAMESNGCGRYILYDELDEQKFAEALNDVLDNRKYRDNMKRRYKIMHDRRFTPIDDADYWIQYVIRHQGAPHLRVDGLELTWYQYLSLDVVFFIVGVTLLSVYLLYFTVKILVRRVRKSRKSKVKKN